MNARLIGGAVEKAATINNNGAIGSVSLTISLAMNC